MFLMRGRSAELRVAWHRAFLLADFEVVAVQVELGPPRTILTAAVLEQHAVWGCSDGPFVAVLALDTARISWPVQRLTVSDRRLTAQLEGPPNVET